MPKSKSLLVLTLMTVAAGASLAGETDNSAATKEELITLEKQSWEAWKSRDAEFFKKFLSDDHVEMGFAGPASKSDVVAIVGSPVCVVQSYSVDRFTVTLLDNNTALVTYHAAQDTSCNNKPVPSPVWVSSLYLRRNNRWVNVLYQQTPTSK
jgi:hypothetical protein